MRQFSVAQYRLNKASSQTPEATPYMTAITTTLPTLLRPIMPKIVAAEMKVKTTSIFPAPTLCTTKPGSIRPMKLHAFKMTS